MAPLFDFAMVAGKENVGNAPAAKFLGAGVLRAFETGTAFAERLGFGAGFVADDIGEKTHDGVDDDERGKCAVSENEIAEGKFLVDEMFADAFVDAFVMATNEDDAVERGEFAGLGLVKFLSAGGEQDDATGLCSLRLDILDGGKDGFALEEHAGSAAVGLFIDGVVLVGGVIAELVQMDLGLSRALGTTHDRGVQGAAQDFGEEGDDVDAHGVKGRGVFDRINKIYRIGSRGNFDGINGITEFFNRKT